MINAFKKDVSLFDEATMNPLLSLQEFVLIAEGAQVDAKTGSGVAEVDCASYNHAFRFTATGTTELGRIELELVKHGTTYDDLAVDIREGFNPDGSTEGMLLKSITIPHEFLPTTKAYWSIPLDLLGLTAGNQYWAIVRKGGDSINHFHLHGETSQDASYPCYRRLGDSGAWEAENAIHFRVYDGSDEGDIRHSIEGENCTITYEYSGEDLTKIYRYIPPSDTKAGGIRDVMTLQFSGDIPKRGVL